MADVDTTPFTSAARGAENVGLKNLEGAQNFVENSLNAMKLGVAMNKKQYDFESQYGKMQLAIGKYELAKAGLEDKQTRGWEALRIQDAAQRAADARGHSALDLRERQIAVNETKLLNDQARKTEMEADAVDYQRRLGAVKNIGTDEWFKEATMINNSVKFPGSPENQRIWARFSQQHYDAYKQRSKDLDDMKEIQQLEKDRSGLTPYQMQRPADYWGYRKPDPAYPQGALYLPIDDSGAAVHWRVAEGQTADVDVLDSKGEPTGQKRPRYQFVTMDFDQYGRMRKLNQKVQEQQAKLLHTPAPPDEVPDEKEHRNLAIYALSNPKASVQDKEMALKMLQEIDKRKRARVQRDIRANDKGIPWIPGL